MKYFCWDPNTCDEQDAVEIEASWPDLAAIDYADRRYAEDDYPKERTIFVRQSDGKRFLFRVVASPSVEFRAYGENAT